LVLTGTEVDGPRDGTFHFVTANANPDQHADEVQAFVRRHKPAIEALGRRYRVSNIRLFGSVARGQSHPTSDVDFLVDPSEDATLFDLAGFRRELAALLGVDVDVVSSRALLPRDGDVSNGAVPL
jgi:uncharacterized protein